MDKPTNQNSCQCLQCLRDRDEHFMIGTHKIPAEAGRMVLCQICGCKRCPHATNHIHPCTNRNEPGQPGSIYQ